MITDNEILTAIAEFKTTSEFLQSRAPPIAVIRFLQATYSFGLASAVNTYRRLCPPAGTPAVSGWETACKDVERRLYACEQQRDALIKALEEVAAAQPGDTFAIASARRTAIAVLAKAKS